MGFLRLSFEPMPEPSRNDAGSDLIGRQTEADLLDALVDGIQDRGGALVVRGEPGIGKSSSLQWTRRRAEALGVVVLTTAGVESEAELAFAGLHQLLLPLTGRRERLSDLQRRALEAAFGVGEDVQPDPFRVAVASFQLVADTADSSPVVLIVDDAHWLDRPSLGVLTFIARRLQSEPVALVAALRPRHQTALDEAGLPILDLDRLSPVAAAELLDRDAPDLHPIVRARSSPRPPATLWLWSSWPGRCPPPSVSTRLRRP